MDLDDCREMAVKLLGEHGLGNWTFDFDNSKRRFGRCSHSLHKISLSKHLVQLNDIDKVEDTIKHEISHALTGSRNGHNNLWREKCREIGCSDNRCYSTSVVTPKGGYILTCPNCGLTARKFRRPTKPVACKSCCIKYNNGIYDERFKFKWRLEN